MKHIEGFTKLGLSGRDSRVYVSLLKEGVSSVRHISDNTGINRGSVYDSIKDLTDAGLVSFQQTKVNKKYFAEDPTKILELIEQRESELKDLKQNVEQSIPDLVSASAYMPYGNIKFYEDHDGVAVILKDVLSTASRGRDKQYLAISSKPIRKYLYRKFPNFTRQRIKQGIFVKVIAIGRGGVASPLSERKWLKVELGQQPSSYTLIYDDKFAMIGLNNDFNPYGIVIEDKGVAAMQRLMFEQLWRGLKS